MDKEVGALSLAMAKMSTGAEAPVDAKVFDFCMDNVNRLWLQVGPDPAVAAVKAAAVAAAHG